MSGGSMDRRSFLAMGVGGAAYLSLPVIRDVPPGWAGCDGVSQAEGVTAVVREPTLFAGIRRPIQSREELTPRVSTLRAALGDRIAGPLTHIFRFDTPVEGYDSEIGFPVREAVDAGDVRTHVLRRMHFFANMHEGSVDTVAGTRGRLYEYMNRVGLSPELELVEVFHRYDPVNPENQRIESMASYLPWPEKYREELVRVLGEVTAGVVWEGGRAMTPHTEVEERCRWVAESIERLKAHGTPEQQFDVLSRVALIRPPEDIARMKRIYEEAGGDIEAVFAAQQENFAKAGRVSGRFDEPSFDGETLHLSKVPYDEKAYLEATTAAATRKAFCFCALVREAKDPRIDPIFCFRAAGWDRQLFEPILGVEFRRCEITHSILKGDRFCAWSYHVS